MIYKLGINLLITTGNWADLGMIDKFLFKLSVSSHI